jgi:hypothetical protein
MRNDRVALMPPFVRDIKLLTRIDVGHGNIPPAAVRLDCRDARMAGQQLYNPEDANCVVFAHQLLERLRDEYDEALSKPTIFSLLKPGQVVTSSGDWLSEITEWSPASDLKISAAAPEFTMVDKQG